mgnify:CR=1 FL=1
MNYENDRYIISYVENNEKNILGMLTKDEIIARLNVLNNNVKNIKIYEIAIFNKQIDVTEKFLNNRDLWAYV